MLFSPLLCSGKGLAEEPIQQVGSLEEPRGGALALVVYHHVYGTVQAFLHISDHPYSTGSCARPACSANLSYVRCCLLYFMGRLFVHCPILRVDHRFESDLFVVIVVVVVVGPFVVVWRSICSSCNSRQIFGTTRRRRY